MLSRQVASIEKSHPPVSQSTGHAIQFYETDPALIEILGQHIGPALQSGDTVRVIATKSHRKELAEELQSRKVNLDAAINTGQYLALDAAEVLAKFMVGEGLDQQKFADTIETQISCAAARTKAGKRLVIFGEMVALLWVMGKWDATIRLEELWNGLAQRYNFHLMCGYPIQAFDRPEHCQFFFNLCGEHTHIHLAESYPVKTPRRRSAARLQQKSKALATEIQISQERVRYCGRPPNQERGSWML
jgi:hypothetical protein